MSSSISLFLSLSLSLLLSRSLTCPTFPFRDRRTPTAMRCTPPRLQARASRVRCECKCSQDFHVVLHSYSTSAGSGRWEIIVSIIGRGRRVASIDRSVVVFSDHDALIRVFRRGAGLQVSRPPSGGVEGGLVGHSIPTQSPTPLSRRR